jgi:hypothetical protein
MLFKPSKVRRENKTPDQTQGKTENSVVMGTLNMFPTAVWVFVKNKEV